MAEFERAGSNCIFIFKPSFQPYLITWSFNQQSSQNESINQLWTSWSIGQSMVCSVSNTEMEINDSFLTVGKFGMPLQEMKWGVYLINILWKLWIFLRQVFWYIIFNNHSIDAWMTKCFWLKIGTMNTCKL